MGTQISSGKEQRFSQKIARIRLYLVPEIIPMAKWTVKGIILLDRNVIVKIYRDSFQVYSFSRYATNVA
jgi:hypothetical protein